MVDESMRLTMMVNMRNTGRLFGLKWRSGGRR